MEILFESSERTWCLSSNCPVNTYVQCSIGLNIYDLVFFLLFMEVFCFYCWTLNSPRGFCLKLFYASQELSKCFVNDDEEYFDNHSTTHSFKNISFSWSCRSLENSHLLNYILNRLQFIFTSLCGNLIQ